MSDLSQVYGEAGTDVLCRRERQAHSAPGVFGHAVDVADNVWKRQVDVVGASFLFIVLLPVLVFAALAILLDSRGPIIFSQHRTGLHGRVFRIRKFRSMRVQEDGSAIRHASRNDCRITRVGAFLRRTSIDELPQLLNVIEGSMSLVGPRPHAVAHDRHYGALLPAYAARFRAKPGLTGLAQISGFRGEIRSIDCMAGRVAADNNYIDSWSIRSDTAILLRTARAVLGDSQAY